MRLLAQRFDKKWEFLRGVQVRQSQQRFFFRVADFDSAIWDAGDGAESRIGQVSQYSSTRVGLHIVL